MQGKQSAPLPQKLGDLWGYLLDVHISKTWFPPPRETHSWWKDIPDFLAKGLSGLQKDLYTFQREEKVLTSFLKEMLWEKGREGNLSLFSTGRIKLLLFNLYLSLHPLVTLLFVCYHPELAQPSTCWSSFSSPWMASEDPWTPWNWFWMRFFNGWRSHSFQYFHILCCQEISLHV